MSDHLYGWISTWGGCTAMAGKIGLRQRARYWFDNTMSRGTVSLIGWLALVSGILIVAISLGLLVVEQPGADGTPPPSGFELLWRTFVSTFGLAIPGVGTKAELALWFLLALGGIFIVSALVGLLTSGMNRQLEQLRKGRSQVVETDHTIVLGWSDQVYTVISELVEANRSRRKATVAILAEQDKVHMEDRLR